MSREDEQTIMAAVRRRYGDASTWRVLDGIRPVLRDSLMDVQHAALVVQRTTALVNLMATDERWEPLFAPAWEPQRPSGISYAKAYLAHRVALAAVLREEVFTTAGPHGWQTNRDTIREAMEYPPDVERRIMLRLARTLEGDDFLGER